MAKKISPTTKIVNNEAKKKLSLINHFIQNKQLNLLKNFKQNNCPHPTTLIKVKTKQKKTPQWQQSRSVPAA